MTYKNRRALLKPADALIILAVIACAVLLIILSQADKTPGRTAVVSLEGRELYRVNLDLDEYKEIPIECGYPLTVVIDGGGAYIKDAHCPDRLCEHIGKITRQGAAIICLPARVTVRITGGDMPDAVTY